MSIRTELENLALGVLTVLLLVGLYAIRLYLVWLIIGVLTLLALRRLGPFWKFRPSTLREVYEQA